MRHNSEEVTLVIQIIMMAKIGHAITGEFISINDLFISVTGILVPSDVCGRRPRARQESGE
jgi:hypothetical protein